VQQTIVNTLQIVLWAIHRILPYARDLREHSDRAVERMIALLREFGLAVPLLVRSSGELIDGHLRLKAAKKLNLKEVPVIICDGWTSDQVKAFRLAVNRSADWATFDMGLVALEMTELQAAEFDLSLTAFDPCEIDRLLSSDEQLADDVPKPKANVVSSPGELWICDDHRVLCGDATIAMDVERVMSGRHCHLAVMDPPYGSEHGPEWREIAGLGAQRQTGGVVNDDCHDWTAAYQLFKGDVAYVWHGALHAGEVAAQLVNCGFEIRAEVIWVKTHFVLGRGHYSLQHQPCYYLVRKNKSARWTGDRSQSTVWEVPNLNSYGGDREETATGHSAQKPVELMRRPIVNHTARNDVIYDPFLGSGTTLIAAELTKRVCCGIELAPEYVDLILRRWQELTGRKAVLADSDKTFDQVEAERALLAQAKPEGD